MKKLYLVLLGLGMVVSVARAQGTLTDTLAEPAVEPMVAPVTGTDAPPRHGKYIQRIKPQGHAYGGMQGSVVNGAGIIGPALDVVYGVRLYDYCFLGLELGYAYWVATEKKGEWNQTHWVALRLNLKTYWPFSEHLQTFADISVGSQGLVRMGVLPFFDFQLGAGLDYRRFSVSTGYKLMKYEKRLYMGYLKLGVRF